MSRIIDYRAKNKTKSAPVKTWRDVERIALRMGLTEGTIKILADRGYGTIRGMRDITEEDLAILPLYVGQQLAVAKLVNHLNVILEGCELDEEEGYEKTITRRESGFLGYSGVGPIGSRGEESKGLDITALKPSLWDIEDKADAEGGELGMGSLPCPYQFILGKTTSKELVLEEFLYGNLLILEYFIEQKPSEVKALLKHIRFLLLKLLHGYPLMGVIDYDTALRKKIEKQNTHLPKEADQELIDKYLMMMTHREEKKVVKKKPKNKIKKGKSKSARV